MAHSSSSSSTVSCTNTLALLLLASSRPQAPSCYSAPYSVYQWTTKSFSSHVYKKPSGNPETTLAPLPLVCSAVAASSPAPQSSSSSSAPPSPPRTSSSSKPSASAWPSPSP